jgi:hypothetical protein
MAASVKAPKPNSVAIAGTLAATPPSALDSENVTLNGSAAAANAALTAVLTHAHANDSYAGDESPHFSILDMI